jgi:hypothetical protein
MKFIHFIEKKKHDSIKKILPLALSELVLFHPNLHINAILLFPVFQVVSVFQVVCFQFSLQSYSTLCESPDPTTLSSLI